MKQQQMTMTPRTWALMALLASIWGFSFLGMRIALHDIGPLWVVAHRTAWGMALLWLWIALRRIPVPRGAGVWGALWVMGVLNNVLPFSLIAWGQQTIDTGLASILNASAAIWGVLIAALFLADERLSPRRAIGVGLGFAGVATAIGLGNLAALDIASTSQLAIVGAAVSYGFAGVWARRRLRGLPPEAAAAGMLTCSAITTLPLAWMIEGPLRPDLAPATWVALAYVGLAATGVAYLLYYRVLAAAGSGNTMLVTLLVAPVAIVAGAVVLDEALPTRAYAGFALLALGLAVLDGRLFARPQKPLAPPAPPG